MKALFTFCLAGLLGLAGVCPSYAAQPLAIANFSVERGLAFSLSVDGQVVGQPTTLQAHLDYLAPGEHQVDLSLATAPAGRGRQRIRATVWLEEGLETSYVLTQRPGRGWQLRQVSTAALPGYGFEDQPGTYAQPAPDGPDYNTPGGNNNAPAGPGYPPVAGPNYPAGPAYPTGPNYPTGPAYPAGPSYPAGPAAGGYPARPVIGPEAADLILALQRCTFDDKRLPLFYQAVSHTYLRSDELAAMLRTMSFPDSQKQVAKFGYSHLSDPQNFNRVLAALTFSTDARNILSDLGLPLW